VDYPHLQIVSEFGKMPSESYRDVSCLAQFYLTFTGIQSVKSAVF
jgi:hypothetical protein